MASSAGVLLREEDIRCPICLGAFDEPVSVPCGHDFCRYCITDYWDCNADTFGDGHECPECGETFSARPGLSINRFADAMVRRFRSGETRENREAKREAKTEDELQRMIRERREKIREIERSVEVGEEDARAVMAESGRVFAAPVRLAERSRAELGERLERQQRARRWQAEVYLGDLRREIAEVEEVRLANSVDARLPSRDWTNIDLRWLPRAGTLSAASGCLADALVGQMKERACDAKLRIFRKYEVDVTLDPDTAHRRLVLSDDGKQVSYRARPSLGPASEDFPDDPARFSKAVLVLGKRGFSSGRFYYEVQVGEALGVVGVVRESTGRKDALCAEIPTCGDDDDHGPGGTCGVWVIAFSETGEVSLGSLWALSHPHVVVLPVGVRIQKVGVFVDYEQGLVGFYDVEARAHIYSFINCAFAGKLFPAFSAGWFNFNCGDVDGTESPVPVTISPVGSVRRVSE